jgi:hypothetical protein
MPFTGVLNEYRTVSDLFWGLDYSAVRGVETLLCGYGEVDVAKLILSLENSLLHHSTSSSSRWQSDTSWWVLEEGWL